jgi:uncharacterized surface protein with fasciclin (FAS1) repeats
MSSKLSQRFFPGSLSLVFALGLWANASAHATTPVKVADDMGGMMKPPTMMKKTPAAKMPAKGGGTIVDVASSVGDFSTLVAAVKAAGLVDTLSGPGPFTVFAPTNAAFAKLPKGTLESLLKPENKAKLQKILTYHVLAGKVPSTAIKPGAVKTVEGNTVALKTMGRSVMVNNAKVIKADIPASNGVIHVIDTVILPPS